MLGGAGQARCQSRRGQRNRDRTRDRLWLAVLDITAHVCKFTWTASNDRNLFRPRASAIHLVVWQMSKKSSFFLTKIQDQEKVNLSVLLKFFF